MPSNSDTTERPSFFRLSRRIFCAVMALIAIFLIWPGYTLFSSATPFIFGFPLSFMWVIFCTIIGFAALLVLYITDHKRGKTE